MIAKELNSDWLDDVLVQLLESPDPTTEEGLVGSGDEQAAESATLCLTKRSLKSSIVLLLVYWGKVSQVFSSQVQGRA